MATSLTADVPPPPIVRTRSPRPWPRGRSRYRRCRSGRVRHRLRRPPVSIVSAPAVGTAQHSPKLMAFWPVPDDDIVLPSRVAVSVSSPAQDSVDLSALRVNNRRWKLANRALAGVKVNVVRAHRAGMYQMALPVAEEAETTPGPDSAIAVLTLEQGVITNLAALFDGIPVGHPLVIKNPSEALTQANAKRDQMLDAILALDPEEAGAPYADAMTDTVDGYADEVANLTEALQRDALTAAARAELTKALKKSTATAARISPPFGGED